MGYYRVNCVILIPAARLTAANTYLTKHGLGSDVFRRALILKADPPSQPARGYAGILRVDLGGWATLKKVVDGQANCYLFSSLKLKTAAADALAFIDEKGFKLKPQG